MPKLVKKSDRIIQLGQKIKALRNRKKFSMERAAYSAGISKESLRRIEGGFVDPRLTSLDKLAEALGVKVGVLVDL